MKNPISWFQIPVSDFDRAVKFYNTIFSIELTETRAFDAKVAIFPHDADGGAVGGALYFGPDFMPATVGTAVLLNGGDDLNEVLLKTQEAGGKILLPKTSISSNGYIAFIIDTEGNRIGLHSRN